MNDGEMEEDTDCNVVASCRGLRGIAMMSVPALIEMMQQRQGCPSDDPGQDVLGQEMNDNLMTLVNDEENDFGNLH